MKVNIVNLVNMERSIPSPTSNSARPIAGLGTIEFEDIDKYNNFYLGLNNYNFKVTTSGLLSDSVEVVEKEVTTKVEVQTPDTEVVEDVVVEEIVEETPEVVEEVVEVDVVELLKPYSVSELRNLAKTLEVNTNSNKVNTLISKIVDTASVDAIVEAVKNM